MKTLKILSYFLIIFLVVNMSSGCNVVKKTKRYYYSREDIRAKRAVKHKHVNLHSIKINVNEYYFDSMSQIDLTELVETINLQAYSKFLEEEYKFYLDYTCFEEALRQKFIRFEIEEDHGNAGDIKNYLISVPEEVNNPMEIVIYVSWDRNFYLAMYPRQIRKAILHIFYKKTFDMRDTECLLENIVNPFPNR